MPKASEPRAAAARGTKAKKDPNAPKRALSSYMLFAQDHRQIVLNENPGIAFGQVGKELGARWKALSDADKKPYEDKAQADKGRYEQAKAAYEAEHGVPAKKSRSKKEESE